MQADREDSSLLKSTVLADSSYRRRQFRTRTVLLRERGENVVDKVAATDEARTFLGSIPAKERENAEYLRGHFNVLCGRERGEGIIYEYIPQPSLAESIGIELGSDHCDKADRLLDLYVHKIHALEHRCCCPSEFLSVIAGEKSGGNPLSTDCLCRGLLDLTPRNILLDGDQWVVIDNEWSFTFPVPTVFLLFRAIRELCFTLQPEIRRTTSVHRPAVGLLTSGLQTRYFPKPWIEYFRDSQVSFSRMLRWEAGFRRYVAGSAHRNPGYVKFWPRETTRLSVWRSSDHDGALAGVRRVLRKAPGAKRLVHWAEGLLLGRRK